MFLTAAQIQSIQTMLCWRRIPVTLFWCPVQALDESRSATNSTVRLMALPVAEVDSSFLHLFVARATDSIAGNIQPALKAALIPIVTILSEYTIWLTGLSVAAGHADTALIFRKAPSL